MQNSSQTWSVWDGYVQGAPAAPYSFGEEEEGENPCGHRRKWQMAVACGVEGTKPPLKLFGVGHTVAVPVVEAVGRAVGGQIAVVAGGVGVIGVEWILDPGDCRVEVSGFVFN
ncbi:MAG: hypothetical protein GWP08_02970 [Nitrospiraceae bacterium]|nr:hypothetical protein [Nitrospiraceae bacterium]